jgi:integrase
MSQPFITRLQRTRYRVKRGGQWVLCKSGTPGCEKVTVESETWYLVYEENGKRVRRDLGVRDKPAALALLADFLRAGDARKAGLPGAFAEHDRKPFAGVLAEYLREKERDGHAGEKHLSDLRKAMTRHAALAGFVRLGDVGRAVIDVIADGGGSARSRNLYAGYWQPFGRWLVRKGYRGDNPFADLPRFQGNAVHERFALDVEDLGRLLAAARERPEREATVVRRGPDKGRPLAELRDDYRAELRLQGEGRALLYEFACLTGLRKGEVARLQARDLRLEGDRPYALVEGDVHRKQKEDARQPLPPALAAKLRDWLAVTGRSGQDRVFRFQADKASVVLNKDLAYAGLLKRDGRGRVFDFHAFRHCTASYLALAGVSPQEAQLYMRVRVR